MILAGERSEEVPSYLQGPPSMRDFYYHKSLKKLVPLKNTTVVVYMAKAATVCS